METLPPCSWLDVNMWPCAAVYSPYTVPDRVCAGGLAVYSPDTVPRVCRGLRSNTALYACTMFRLLSLLRLGLGLYSAHAALRSTR